MPCNGTEPMGADGNACASRVWKGSSMFFRLKFLIFLLIPCSVFSINFKVNDTQWQQCPGLSDNYLYTILYESNQYKGISLDEILPLMTEIWSITFHTKNAQKTINNDDLAENISCSYAVKTPSGWDILFNKSIVRGVTGIEINGDPVEEGPLEVWISWEGIPQLKEEITRFAELHDITVNTVFVPKTESKLISIIRGGGRPPDVLMIQSDYVQPLVKYNALQNLDYMIPENLEFKGTEVFRFEDKTWAIPFYYDTQLLFYNKDLIPDTEFKPDWNLDDFERITGRLKEQGIIPAAWNVYSAYWLIPFQIGFGKVPFIDADGQVTVNDNATINALKYLKELKNDGLIKIMERDAMISLFAAGEIGMILSSSFSIPRFEELGLNFGIQSYPRNTDTGIYVSPLLDFKGFAITRKTKNPILARRLIQYLSGIGVQQRFPAALSKLPIAVNVREIGSDENDRILHHSAEIGYPVPSDKSYGIFKSTMWSMLPFIFTDRLSVEEALEKAQLILDNNK